MKKMLAATLVIALILSITLGAFACGGSNYSRNRFTWNWHTCRWDNYCGSDCNTKRDRNPPPTCTHSCTHTCEPTPPPDDGGIIV